MMDVTVTVPYEDFVEGQRAIATLNIIRTAASKKALYSDDITRMLGVQKEEDKSAGAN